MIHKISGTVIQGNRIGRTLRFPTANIALDDDIPVRDGVYAAEVRTEGKIWPAMVNIGTRPTVSADGKRFAEAHLFGFDGDIYGRTITIFLLQYIRGERRFTGLDALNEQLQIDKQNILNLFNK